MRLACTRPINRQVPRRHRSLQNTSVSRPRVLWYTCIIRLQCGSCVNSLVDNEHEVQELLTLPAENKINRLKKRNSKVLLVSRYAIFLESASSCVVCKRSHKTLTPLFARRTLVCRPKTHTGCRKGSQWPSERDRESKQQHRREQSSQTHKMNMATTLHDPQSSFILLCVCSSAPPSVKAKY